MTSISIFFQMRRDPCHAKEIGRSVIGNVLLITCYFLSRPYAPFTVEDVFFTLFIQLDMQ
jgi:hypothetical protein